MNRPAFTLLETILAMAITIMILGTVYAFYSYSLNLVEAGHTHLEESQLAQVVLEQIAGELRSAPGRRSHFGMVLEGRPHEVRFLTTVVPSRLVFFPKSVFDTEVNVEHDVRRVEYELAVDDEEEKVLGLKRSELRVLLAPIIEETADEELVDELTDAIERIATEEADEDRPTQQDRPVADERILSEKIRYVQFQYYNGRVWSGFWSGGVVPRAIRIIIGFKDIPDDEIEDMTNLPWSQRPWRDDLYSMVVSLALSEELAARHVRAEEGP